MRGIKFSKSYALKDVLQFIDAKKVTLQHFQPV